jgi:hypothetical protein
VDDAQVGENGLFDEDGALVLVLGKVVVSMRACCRDLRREVNRLAVWSSHFIITVVAAAVVGQLLLLLLLVAIVLVYIYLR